MGVRGGEGRWSGGPPEVKEGATKAWGLLQAKGTQGRGPCGPLFLERVYKGQCSRCVCGATHPGDLVASRLTQ